MKTGEFATLIGVSRQAVLAAINRGRLSKSASKVGERWEIDPELGPVEYAQNVDMTRRPPRKGHEPVIDGEGDYPDFNESRAKREFHMAALAEMDVKEREGKLIDRDKIRDESFRLGRRVRDAMLNIPDRISADLAAEMDAFKVHLRLTKEIREALTDLVVSERNGDT